ncbi:glycoside hydrolase family 73 protein [Levilactobacillus zymae]|uniref:glycoside hydrolase family 73 protein n=1 Tax=Levilactobacillus zymae TaxID=267363 RepID=UPI003FCDCAF7
MKGSKQWLIAVAIIGVGLGSAVGVTSHAATTQQTFISKLKSPVKTVANQYKLYPSVMMAQAALESAWGTSQLTLQANNYFGIKGSYNGQSVSMETSEYDANGKLYTTSANFRKYPNAKASMTDNAKLLRNGLSYNTAYYSGTWRENAATYEAAANALTGTYATSPHYGASLISLIQQYDLASLDKKASTTTSSSSSAASSSSSASTVQPVTYATAKYYGASGTQTARLSSKYTSYRAYNHIKGTREKVTKTAWSKLKVGTGQLVYLNMRGVKKDPTTGKKTTWYRVTLSPAKSAKKYWVYRSALTLPTVKYTMGKATVKLSTTSGDYYNHVFNSPYLAKSQGALSQLTAKSYTADQQAVKTQDGVKSTWYRIGVAKAKYWVAADRTTASPQYDYVAYTKTTGTRTLSKKYTKYHVYNHVKKTHFNQQELKWPSQAKVGTKVTFDQIGTKPAYKTTWYRIQFSGDKTKYWVAARALN